MSLLSGRPTRRQLLGGAVGVSAMAVGLAALAGSFPSLGRGRAEPPLIGYALAGFEETDTGRVAFYDSLREQGLIEGESIRVAWRYAGGNPNACRA
jgi:hypothetical protein